MNVHHISIIFILGLCSFCLDCSEANEAKNDDCLLVIQENDFGLLENRIQCGKICAVEVQMPGYGESDLHYRIITDRHTMVKEYLADNDKLIECAIVEKRAAIREFIDSFSDPPKNDVSFSLKGNFSDIKEKMESLGNNTFFKDILEVSFHKSQCSEFHMEKYRALQREHLTAQQNSENRIDGKDTTMKTENNDREVMDGEVHGRQKRFAYVPETKWCGAGNRADGYHDLGSARGADMCCREHDHCHDVIESWETKYHYYNWRLYAICHQSCDEKFYACLKAVGTYRSDMVGNLFFNVIGISNFLVEPTRYCVERKWWGGCKTYGTRYQAQIFYARPYY